MPASTRIRAGEEDLVTLKWEDPPAIRRGRKTVDWSKILEPLRHNPNRWARVRNYDKPPSAASSVSGIRKRVGPEFEVVGRKIDGGSAIFARFIGGKK